MALILATYPLHIIIHKTIYVIGDQQFIVFYKLGMCRCIIGYPTFPLVLVLCGIQQFFIGKRTLWNIAFPGINFPSIPTGKKNNILRNHLVLVLQFNHTKTGRYIIILTCHYLLSRIYFGSLAIAIKKLPGCGNIFLHGSSCHQGPVNDPVLLLSVYINETCC